MESDKNKKIVLVTGSNKGIGFGIVETLLEKNSPLRVILTSRNIELGEKSYSLLLDKYPSSKSHFYYHQLDITKKDSISNLISWIKETFGKIDYLVNNAGTATHGDLFNIDVCNSTFEVNVYGTINFTESMLENDVINKDGKIIFLGSCAGYLNKLKNENLIKGFKDAKKFEDLFNMGELFKKSIVNESLEKDGWPRNTYSVSKMIVNSYGKILGEREDIVKRNIGVYVAHPGWVRTDMAGPKAPLSIKEGAVNEVFLIELPDGINPELQGKYFEKCKVASFE